MTENTSPYTLTSPPFEIFSWLPQHTVQEAWNWYNSGPLDEIVHRRANPVTIPMDDAEAAHLALAAEQVIRRLSTDRPGGWLILTDIALRVAECLGPAPAGEDWEVPYRYLPAKSEFGRERDAERQAVTLAERMLNPVCRGTAPDVFPDLGAYIINLAFRALLAMLREARSGDLTGIESRPAGAPR
jgi:hypothetical protein